MVEDLKITSHFEGFKWRPIVLHCSSSFTMSSATTWVLPSRVRSSRYPSVSGDDISFLHFGECKVLLLLLTIRIYKSILAHMGILILFFVEGSKVHRQNGCGP